MATKRSDPGAVPAPGFVCDSGMDDDVMNLGRGSRVWYKQDATTWVLAELREPAAAAPDAPKPKRGAPPPPAIASITLASGKPVDGVPVTQLMPANPEMQATIPDLTQLSYLNEPSILGNLQLRYSKDMIYTCAGPVLIALNPCKELPLYTEEVQHDYKSERGEGPAGAGRGAAGALRRRGAGSRQRGGAGATA
jgi:myosin heavy subunit